MGWPAIVTAITASVAALLAPRLLLLLRAEEAEAASVALAACIATGGILAGIRTWWVLGRHHYVFRALTLGSRTVEPQELGAVSQEIWKITATWLSPPFFALTLFATALRPTAITERTALSLAVLSAVFVATAALPVHVLIRASLLRVLELADPETMRELVTDAERRGATRRVSWRMAVAVAAPVAFVALGSALIASAHLRRADQLQREETARALARATLELGPGVVASAGLDEAIARAAELGFRATIGEQTGEHGLFRDEHGRSELVVPLNGAEAHVRFDDSAVPVLGLEAWIMAISAVGLAGSLGAALGRVLGRDLRHATQGVRSLIEGKEGEPLVEGARFQLVAELGAAIERLALRFQVFARAQRRAIESREGVARMRGLFFASVSHDLKSPLNAILGFTEIVRQSDELTHEQVESLDQIERSGHELLALIETILDAARVEARQLTLERELVSVKELVEQVEEIGIRLGSKRNAWVRLLVPPDLPDLQVDRLRLARALATFVAHGIRTSLGGPVEVRAQTNSRRSAVEIHIQLAKDRSSAHQLDSILDPKRRPAATEPRGLALGLGLARTMIELHGGSVRLVALNETTTSVAVTLPSLPKPLPLTPGRRV